MHENSEAVSLRGNHNLTGFCGAPFAHRERDLVSALVGPTPLPRKGPAGWADHSVRYGRRNPVGDVLTIMHGRLENRHSPGQVLVFPEMLRTHVMAVAAAMRPLDLVCSRELNFAETDAGAALDKEQFDLERQPTVHACRSFLRQSAEYRARLDALEIFCYAFMAAKGQQS